MKPLSEMTDEELDAITPSKRPIHELSDEELDAASTMQSSPKMPTEQPQDMIGDAKSKARELLGLNNTQEEDRALIQKGIGALGAGITRGTAGSYTVGGLLNAAVQPYFDLSKGINTGEFKQTPVLDSFKEGYDMTKRGVKRLAKKNPEMALLGEMAPAVAETALAGGATRGLIKGPGFLKSLARATVPNLAVGQGTRGTEIDPTSSAIEAVLGLASEAVPSIAKKGKEFIGSDRAQRAIESYLPGVGKYLKAGREDAEKVAREAFDVAEANKASQQASNVAELKDQFRVQKEGAQNAFDAEVESAKSALKDLPKKDIPSSGDAFSKKIKDLNYQIGKDYQKEAGPIAKKYALRKASPEKVRQGIVKILDSMGLVDDKGRIIKSQISSIIAPERKNLAKKLVTISNTLKKNPSISALKQIEQDLSSLANFSSIERSAEDKIFGQLSHHAKESIFDSLSVHASPDEVSKLVNANKRFLEGKEILSQAGGLGDLYGEQVVSRAKSKLPGSFIEQTLKRFPKMRGEIADVVVNDIVSRGTTPKTLTKAIDDYGREPLKKLLGKDFEALEQAEKQYKSLKNLAPEMKAPSPIPLKRGKFTPPESGLKKGLNKIADKIDPRKAETFRFLAPYLSKQIEERR